MWIGAGKGYNSSDVVMMTLGTGIGGAVMSGGRMIHGATGMAGEIGHSIVNKWTFEQRDRGSRNF